MPVQGHVDLISRSEILGWAIDWDEPATPVNISIVVNGREVGRCKAELMREHLKSALGGAATGAHEFRFRFPRQLDNFSQHNVEIWAVDKKVVLNKGRRTIYAQRSGKSRFIPILLTSSGRSGTTMLMQEFSTHPEIAVAGGYPFEIKLTSYYAAAWNVLTASTYIPTEAEAEFSAYASQNLLIGRNPWNRPDLLGTGGHRHAVRLIGQTLPDRLTDLFRSTVEEYYAIIADETGSDVPVHLYAEKGVLEEPVRRAIRLMFGDIREIVMVRDPRDYICSAKNFWKHDTDAVISAMRSELPVIMNIHKEENSDVTFVRYEDLILNSAQTRKRLYDFLGCESDFTPRKLSQNLVPAEHRTSKSPAESIGRFRNELDQKTQDLCTQHLGAFMELFDYKN